MTYREFTQTNFDNIENTYIEVTNEDGSLTTFLKSEDNPAYVAWLEEQENGTISQNYYKRKVITND